jgi:hypothetical protein
MYTLSEYYSTVFFLSQMNSSDLEDFVALINDNHLLAAAQVHLGITAELHQLAYGQNPEKLCALMNEVKVDLFERERFRKSLVTPHKFHVATLGRALREKFFGEEKTRASIARQVASMIDPRFAKDVIERITDHVFRESY